MQQALRASVAASIKYAANYAANYLACNKPCQGYSSHEQLEGIEEWNVFNGDGVNVIINRLIIPDLKVLLQDFTELRKRLKQTVFTSAKTYGSTMKQLTTSFFHHFKRIQRLWPST